MSKVNQQDDIIVIGAGIVGIAHAYHALRTGIGVTLIERNPKPMDATVRNFGQVVPSGFGSDWQDYGRRSLELYNELQAQVDITIRQEGTLYVASDHQEEALIHELRDINQANGYQSEILNQQELLQYQPILVKDYAKSGLLFPQELVIDPRVGISRLIEFLVEQYGLKYIPNTAINNVYNANGKVNVSSTRGDLYSAQKVFLCSGTEFELLFPDRFYNSDIQLVQLQMMDTVPQSNSVRCKGSLLTGWSIRRYEAFKECPSYASVKDAEDTNSYQYQNGIHILFKQLLDGSMVIGDSHRYQDVVEGPRFLEYQTDDQLNTFMLSEAQKIIKLDSWEVRNTWMGYYSQCKGCPIFNETMDEHIHIITAIGGKGMTASLGYAEESILKSLSLNSPLV